MLDFQAARYLNDGDVPVAVGNDHPTSSPMGVYEASDGPFNLGSSGEGTWQRLCGIIEREDLIANPDFANERLRVRNRPKLNEILAPIFAQHTVNHWVEALNDGGVPCGPVYTIPQVFEDPPVAHLEVVATAPTSVGQDMKVITQPVRLSRTPAEVNHGAPQWGEHTESVLLEAGFDATQIKAFADKGVV
jgi:crotonobetainyl-CoA:carnitine CoA-transferase CaiB-like acyl-CoA transferase